jgi:hypothetical protein
MILQFNGFKEVFSRLNYIFLTFFLTLFFYLFNVILADFLDFKDIFLNYEAHNYFKLLVSYFIGFPTTITLFSAVSIFVIALLFGSYISLAVYKTKQVKIFQEKSSIFGSMGIFLGIFAPGCATCGLGLASLFGIGGFLFALPFRGLEISGLAILLLGYANWKVAGKINKNVCSIKFKKN